MKFSDARANFYGTFVSTRLILCALALAAYSAKYHTILVFTDGPQKADERATKSILRHHNRTSSLSLLEVGMLTWPRSANRVLKNFGVKLRLLMLPLSLESLKMFFGVSTWNDIVDIRVIQPLKKRRIYISTNWSTRLVSSVVQQNRTYLYGGSTTVLTRRRRSRFLIGNLRGKNYENHALLSTIEMFKIKVDLHLIY